MKNIAIIITSFVLFSCMTTNKVESIRGDLYFQMVDFFNFYNAPDSVIKSFEEQLSNIDMDTINENDKKAYELIKYALDQNILTLPYIRLTTDSDEKIMLYMDTNNYERFDSLRCFDLREQGKKIRIVALAEDISFKDIKAYRLKEIKEFKKIDGQTICRK